ncbi:MAG: RNA-protein complex protein Nop10 [Nitrososphaerota archaeon]|uniref:RNA-protein complex protein Nop10 n=1 Tax=Candidatus Bathycorpusculum sp. TaxID=2994959 RepID=UPI002835B140|nr:RNA-protein complex protein Nop10 [Candidatus Termiticorpusculum sp.]MCL2256703.1 RNA-protein complex protein Nop10 [Candidatus Termiticorpusculum sp.]MCL2293135.1 RNA-protein complex protein Nop10 [Candidatus Termiticorpusculum sp.]MDR0460077.1 RNA-protein complex protein Nop10 [Nitrososphaerota archaeon]
MVWQLRKCTSCNCYTLNKLVCHCCGGTVKIPHPAKFSPDDKYMKYRLAMKRGSSETNERNIH